MFCSELRSSNKTVWRQSCEASGAILAGIITPHCCCSPARPDWSELLQEVAGRDSLPAQLSSLSPLFLHLLTLASHRAVNCTVHHCTVHCNMVLYIYLNPLHTKRQWLENKQRTLTRQSALADLQLNPGFLFLF